jgi:hypothetical protein
LPAPLPPNEGRHIVERVTVPGDGPIWRVRRPDGSTVPGLWTLPGLAQCYAAWLDNEHRKFTKLSRK